MRFTINRSDFADSIKWVASALDKRPPSPVMGGIRITASEDVVTVAAWNFTAAHSSRLSATVADPGDLLIPGAALALIVGSLKTETLTLNSNEDGTEVVIAAGASKFAIRTLPVSEYMAAPPTSDPIGYVSGAGLAEVVKATEWAAADDMIVEDLVQVHVEAIDDTLTLVASDRFVFAFDSLAYKGEPFTVGLLPDMLTAAVSGLSRDANVGIGFDAGMVTLHGSDRTVSMRTVDKDFMAGRNWQDFVGKISTPNTVQLDARDLADAVKRVGALADENAAVNFRSEGEQIGLSAAGQKGSASDAIPAHVDGEKFDSAFAPRILTSALAIFSGQVNLGYSTPTGPMRISCDAQPNRTAIVMPRRLV